MRQFLFEAAGVVRHLLNKNAGIATPPAFRGDIRQIVPELASQLFGYCLKFSHAAAHLCIPRLPFFVLTPLTGRQFSLRWHDLLHLVTLVLAKPRLSCLVG